MVKITHTPHTRSRVRTAFGATAVTTARLEPWQVPPNLEPAKVEAGEEAAAGSGIAVAAAAAATAGAAGSGPRPESTAGQYKQGGVRWRQRSVSRPRRQPAVEGAASDGTRPR